MTNVYYNRIQAKERSYTYSIAQLFIQIIYNATNELTLSNQVILNIKQSSLHDRPMPDDYIIEQKKIKK